MTLRLWLVLYSLTHFNYISSNPDSGNRAQEPVWNVFASAWITEHLGHIEGDQSIATGWRRRRPAWQTLWTEHRTLLAAAGKEDETGVWSEETTTWHWPGKLRAEHGVVHVLWDNSTTCDIMNLNYVLKLIINNSVPLVLTFVIHLSLKV